MMESSSRMARSVSFSSAACFTRDIRRSAVSLPEASQSAQIRFSTSLAVSASGAAFSASNRKSMLLPRSGLASRGLSGSAAPGGGTWACACARSTGPASGAASTRAKKSTANLAVMDRLYGRGLLSQPQNTQTFVSGAVFRRSALARLEPALGLVDDVDATLAPHEPVVAVPRAQRFERIADFHNGFLGALPG